MRALFIAAFLILPAVSWAVVTVVLNRLSEKHLQKEREAFAQECIIRLNQEEGTLYYRSTTHPTEKKLAYDHIRQARLTYPIGGARGKTPRLTLDTGHSPVILLNEALGTQVQKIDLANEIQEELRSYAYK